MGSNPYRFWVVAYSLWLEQWYLKICHIMVGWDHLPGPIVKTSLFRQETQTVVRTCTRQVYPNCAWAPNDRHKGSSSPITVGDVAKSVFVHFQEPSGWFCFSSFTHLVMIQASSHMSTVFSIYFSQIRFRTIVLVITSTLLVIVWSRSSTVSWLPFPLQ